MAVILGNRGAHRYCPAIEQHGEGTRRLMQGHALLGRLGFKDNEMPETGEDEMIYLAPSTGFPVEKQDIMQGAPVSSPIQGTINLPP